MALIWFLHYTNVATLNDWKTATSQDAASTYKLVNFVSATDLHLTGSSNGDFTLKALPLAWVPVDIDGSPRSLIFPYKGAHEGSIALPVEFTTFTAQQSGEAVILDWSTSTETNNMGFEVERSVDGLTFNKIGFIKGAGTSTTKQSYKFTDNSALNGTNYYRLRQIDLNGEFVYTSAIEVNFASVNDFTLHQNYPNPFNPSTA
ncbi:MAG: hypothetical protein IPG53_21365 [Ignavibacteriales bacterium]|nr:hypothetical protein [Ignavibacteriales bacterium]